MIGNKIQPSLYRIAIAIGGTTLSIAKIAAIETSFGAEKFCRFVELAVTGK